MANNDQIPNMTPAIGLDGSELFEIVQSGESKRVDLEMMSNFVIAFFGGAGITQLTGDVTAGPGSGSEVATISPRAVSFDKVQEIATLRLLGRQTAGSGDVEALTGTEATALLNTFTSTLKGLVPLSGGGTAKYLRADGAWVELPWQETVAAGDETTAMTIGVKTTFRAPCAVNLTSVSAELTEAATGATLFQVDVLLNGVSIFTTQITIDAGETTSLTAATPSVLTSNPLAIANNDRLQVQVIAVGNTTAGVGLKVTFRGTEA